MKEEFDSLEQHSRRNCVRIGSMVRNLLRRTRTDIVKVVAKSAGVNLTDEVIDRSHRVGKVSDGILRQAYIGEIDVIPTQRGFER